MAPIPYDSSSAVRIYMAPLLSGDEMARIQVSGGGWTCSAFAEHIELKPTASGQIPADGFSAIELDSVLAGGGAATGHFRFEYAGFASASGGHRLQPVFRQHPPGAGDHLPVQARCGARSEYAGQQGDTVYVTPAGVADIANYIVVQIANGDAAHPIPLQSGTSGYIVFSFVTGHSRNDLCTDAQLNAVELSVLSSDPEIQWSAPEKDVSGPTPVWTVRSAPGSTKFLSAAGVALFRFYNLVSHLEPGWASQLYVQYSVAGYDESYDAVLLQKTPPVPYIRQYDAVSRGALLPDDAWVWFRQEIDLIWDIFAANGCRLRFPGFDQDFPPNGKTLVHPDQASVTYALIPEIPGMQSSSVEKKINVLPASASLTASATLVAAGTPVTLTWNCLSGTCTLSGTGLDASPAPVSGSRVVTPQGPCQYKIACAGLTTVHAEVTVDVIVEADLRVWRYQGVTDRHPYNVILVNWSTRFASSCAVSNVRTGEVISTDRSGQTSFWADQYFQDPGLYTYKVVAQGSGGPAVQVRRPD